MRISRHDGASVYLINAYEPGKITINRQDITTSVIVTPESLSHELPVEQIGDLNLTHLDHLLAWQPELILLGTGPKQVFPNRELIRGIISQDIGFEAITTCSASQTFNLLASEGRRVAAVLFVKP